MQQLLESWRQAEITVNGTVMGTREHEEALRRSDEARIEYQSRLEAMKQDLRDG